MKYYLDTEFHEYQKQPKIGPFKIGNPIDTIELISIGIVSEDGREYYAICNEFDLEAAWNNEWLRENVLENIALELFKIHCKKAKNHSLIESKGDYKSLKNMLIHYGKSRECIAEEIKTFINEEPIKTSKSSNTTILTNESRDIILRGYVKPEFYAYYADYDWVVFCWLFGRMIDLPKGFPMYCIDLKQELENKISIMTKYNCLNSITLEQLHILAGKNITFGEAEKIDWNKWFKEHPDYPKQTNEHNALADAKWNRELHLFINNL